MTKIANFATSRKSKLAALVALAVLSVASNAAMAQAAGGDYGAGAAITAAQTVALTIIGGFITMGVAVWGGSYILRRFFPKGK